MSNEAFAKSLQEQETYLRDSVYDKFYWWIEENPIKCLPAILRYYRIIDRNFLAWLTLAMIRSQNEVAKEIMRKNLLVEVQENHPKLLKKWFTAVKTGYEALAGIQEIQAHVDDFQKDVEYLYHYDYFETNIRVLCESGYGVVIIALLEHHSKTFMRLLSELAKKLGYQQSAETMMYLHVHGEADALHAHEAQIAITNELTDSETSIFMLNHSSSLVVAMLEFIFESPKMN